MKSTVEQLSPTRVRINVEVPFDELKSNFDSTYRKLAKMVRIDGFRPGKVPARVLESRLGRDAVLQEVVQEALPAKYMEVINSGEMRPIGNPQLTVTKIEDGEYVAFSAEVDIRPKIDIPAYDSLAVTVEDTEVSDQDVEQRLEQLRARFGELKSVDRPVADGDFVVIDTSATLAGQDIEDARSTGLSYQVGSGELVEGIDQALIGATNGETRTFETTLSAGEHAGQQAEFTVVVNSVKERELPVPDDEFAQSASEFDTMDELRDNLRAELVATRELQVGAQARDRVLEVLLDAIEVPLPPAVVESEVQAQKQDAVKAFGNDDGMLSEWLEHQGYTAERFDAEVRSDAERSVKVKIVLDTIAEAEQVQVTEAELTERIIYQARRYGLSPDDYLQRIQEAGQIPAIFAEIRRGKAIATVLRGAKVTDASGNDVDIDKLFGPSSPPATAAATQAE